MKRWEEAWVWDAEDEEEVRRCVSEADENSL